LWRNSNSRAPNRQSVWSYLHISLHIYVWISMLVVGWLVGCLSICLSVFVLVCACVYVFVFVHVWALTPSFFLSPCFFCHFPFLPDWKSEEWSIQIIYDGWEGGWMTAKSRCLYIHTHSLANTHKSTAWICQKCVSVPLMSDMCL